MTVSNPIQDWHRIAVEMLMMDADLALQCMTALFAGDDKDAVARVVRSTKETYELIEAKRKNLRMTATDATILNDKMDRLRARLKFMGEAV